MAQNDHQSTDARPIKPVSSLLSHFEGLKTHLPQTKQHERSPLAVRASFDLPRPDSPWTANTDPTRGQPQTPGPNPRTEKESPSRSGHRRPMSMHMGSSPQLTPAVNVESPKSPPRSFFNRSNSRSPERIDNTPFGKVRELISAHSSRASSRPPSPEAKGNIESKKVGTEPVIQVGIPSGGRSSSPTRPPPPPVNRAEKPKIPAKPLNIIQTDVAAGRLTPEPLVSAATALHVSPFSTPPSSEGSASPDGVTQPTPFPGRQNAPPEPEVSKSRDPRLLGFGAATLPVRANTVGERRPSKDNPSPKRHVSENVHIPTPQARDPRQLGLSNTSVQEDKVRSDLTQALLPPQPHPISTQIRDPRQLGFTNSPAREDRPELPARRNVLAPPRPSQESKNLPPRRASPQANMDERPRQRSPQATMVERPRQRSPPGNITDRPQRQSPQSTGVERPRQKSVPTIPRSSLPPQGDMRFPPPPKRNTFNEGQSVTPPHSRADAVPAVPGLEENHGYIENSDGEERMPEPSTVRTDYPDATQSNRRPPSAFEVRSRSDGRVFDVCGTYLCVSGYVTRVFDMSTGEQILALNHGETVKVSSVRFKPSANLEGEGARLWLGSNIGDLQEIDVATQSVVASSLVHNRRDVIRILRHRKQFWTLDDDGKLFVWPEDKSGEPNLKGGHVAHKVPRGHTFSMVVNDDLWLATGKEVRIYRPGNEASFTALTAPLMQSNLGDVTSGTYSNERGGQMYLGHTDGKISIYSTKNYSHLGSVKVSDYKINCLSYVGDRLWAAYKTGKVYVYDTSCTPWKVKKDWNAHGGPVHNMVLDPSSVWTLSRLQVATAGHDGEVRLWDATLEDDWMEWAMQERDAEYCSFREVKAAVVTWNVGAAVPGFMREDFIADAIHAENPPEILAFGFQEVVDLEDKAITAKSILGFAKKKDTAKTEHHQSRVYREWRDYLARSIDRCTDVRQSYSEIQTSSLIGLFQCVFVKQQERRNVTNVAAANVKCGMGGHYGNKGALITRFMLDNSSLCFVNCHLAAGQSQTSHRNNDIATILESEGLPEEQDHQLRSSLFVGGGDGTQILDHEICILNGDLNYRIDTIPRDTVIKMIRNNELPKLLDRDQLLVCRRRIAGFRLAPFAELPITFAPTYKYDVGTDNYDSSEKRRAPAWCDRLLYRGSGRVKQLEYRRHEVKVSDHRPVSGTFKIRVKRVDAVKQDRVRQECAEEFQLVRKQMCEAVCVRWLVDVVGVSEREARSLLAG